jgi:SHS2 domain-containing protein
VGSYRFVEDVAIADCAIDIEGRDPSDLFETAATALAELMVDLETLGTGLSRTVTLEAPGLDLLLFDWLSELIYRKDRDRELFPSADVQITGDGTWRLQGVIRGAAIDPATMALRADPKAVTFHQFEVGAMDGAWRARVVIDI